MRHVRLRAETQTLFKFELLRPPREIVPKFPLLLKKLSHILWLSQLLILLRTLFCCGQLRDYVG